MFSNYDDLLEMEEACEILKMSRNCLYGILRSGDLKGYQQGRIWKIPKQAIIDYVTRKSGMSS